METKAQTAAAEAARALLAARRCLNGQLSELSAACSRAARAAQAEPRDQAAWDEAQVDADAAYQEAQETLELVHRLAGEAAWAEETRRRAFA